MAAAAAAQSSQRSSRRRIDYDDWQRVRRSYGVPRYGVMAVELCKFASKPMARAAPQPYVYVHTVLQMSMCSSWSVQGLRQLRFDSFDSIRFIRFISRALACRRLGEARAMARASSTLISSAVANANAKQSHRRRRYPINSIGPSV